MDDAEERFNILLNAPGGILKIARAIEGVLYSKAPQFVKQVKGKKDLSLEVLAASQTIVYEEERKGRENLYHRIKDRVDNYWETSMS